MTEFKVTSPVEETAEQIRQILEGIENYAKLDDYTIDDECGGFIRTMLYKDSLLGPKYEVLTITLDNLMGYTRVHAASSGHRGGAVMEHTLGEALRELRL